MNKTFLTVFALIGIFFCGAIVGGVVAVRYVRVTVQKKAAEKQLNTQQWVRITNRLNPTEEQREKIRASVATYMKEQQNSRKIEQAASLQFHDDIREILTPEQKSEYDKLETRMRENDRLWQRWLKDQRAKYGDSPLVIPTPATTPLDVKENKEGKPRTGKKHQDGATNAGINSDTTNSGTAVPLK